MQKTRKTGTKTLLNKMKKFFHIKVYDNDVTHIVDYRAVQGMTYW